jgi:protein-disulfide isomerase
VSLTDGPSLPAPSGPDRGSAKLRRQIGTLRVLTILSLVLVVVLAVWSVVGIVALSSQVSSLEQKVDALSARLSSERSASSDSTNSGAQTAPAPTASAQPAPAPATGTMTVPSGADKAGAIVVGDPDAAKVVEVYVDYQCPYCQRWEIEIGTALMERAMQPGSGLVVRQYNMAFLGESNRSLNPPGASARAANAAACVLDGDGVDAFVAFNTAIFAAPGGTDPATRFDEASLAGLASDVGASDETLACIEEGRFMPFVSATTLAAFARGVTGTPTVLINGKQIQDSFGDPQLRSLLTM